MVTVNSSEITPSLCQTIRLRILKDGTLQIERKFAKLNVGLCYCTKCLIWSAQQLDSYRLHVLRHCNRSSCETGSIAEACRLRQRTAELGESETRTAEVAFTGFVILPCFTRHWEGNGLYIWQAWGKWEVLNARILQDFHKKLWWKCLT
jgi:hypothetical protein